MMDSDFGSWRAGAIRLAAFVVLTSPLAVAQPNKGSPSPQRALLDQYCVACHNQRLRTAGLTLDIADVDDVGGNAAVWEKVLRKVRTGAMPPASMPRPNKAATDAFASWLETALD